jgi:hypothetical protein
MVEVILQNVGTVVSVLPIVAECFGFGWLDSSGCA